MGSETPISRCIDYYLFIFGTCTTYLFKMLTILISFYFLVLLSYLSNGTPRYIEHLFTTIAFSILSLRRLPFFCCHSHNCHLLLLLFLLLLFCCQTKNVSKEKKPIDSRIFIFVNYAWYRNL